MVASGGCRQDHEGPEGGPIDSRRSGASFAGNCATAVRRHVSMERIGSPAAQPGFISFPHASDA